MPFGYEPALLKAQLDQGIEILAAVGADQQPVWNFTLPQPAEFEVGQELRLRVMDKNTWPIWVRATVP